MSKIRSAQYIEEGNALKAKLVASQVSSLEKASLFNDFSWLFNHLSTTLKEGSPDDQWVIVLNDTLAICLLRMTQFCKASKSSFSSENPSIDDFTLQHSETIFKYIIHYSNHSFAPLINSVTSLLNKLVAFNYVNNPSTSQGSLEWAASQILSNPGSLAKNSYGTIDILLKNLQNKQFVFEKFPEFPGNCIQAVANNHLASSTSKTLVALYRGVYDPKKSPRAWYESWNQLVIAGLSDPETSPNILTYFLPNLFQICPESLQLLVDDVGKSTEIDFSALPEDVLDIIFNLYNIAQEFTISTNLPSAQLKAFLTHYSPKFRLNAISLLLGGSAKNTKSLPIPPSIYHTIRETKCFDTFLNDYEDVESRNKFITIVSHFLGFRFKESIYSLEKELSKLRKKRVLEERQREIVEYLESGREFINWLKVHLISKLNSSSNYSQLITAMQLLKSMAKLEGTLGFSIYRESEIIHFLIQNLFNNYENIRDLSKELLLSCEPPSLLQELMPELQVNVVGQSKKIMSSLSGRKSDGAAKFYEFLTEYYLANNQDRYVQLIQGLLDLISKGLVLLKEEPDTNNPEMFIHGQFQALNLVFQHLNEKNILAHREFFVSAYGDIIRGIFTIWEQMKSYLTTDSVQDEEDEIIGDNDKALMNNYAWKVIKESTTLLSTLLEKKLDFIPQDLFLQLCDMTMDQLSSVKHRGAFSAIYPTFISICKLCNQSPALMEYPHKWLVDNIKLIESKTQSISRRSGGIPYLITGILSAVNPTKSAKNKYSRDYLTEYAFSELIEIASRPYTHIADQKDDISQVHAFNSIKQIFNESSLSNESLRYVEVSLDLSLNNFRSSNWSIRNCAVMLFGTIQRRVFGTRNQASYPSKLFFEQFPFIDKLLLKHLSSVDEQTFENNQIIFPIVIVLLKLDTSSYNDATLEKFKPKLLEFLGNKFWKIREIVSMCVASIFTASELIELTLQFLKEDRSTDLNQVQGKLLVILASLPKIVTADSSSVKELVLKKLAFYLEYNSCLVSKAYLDIFGALFKNEVPTKYLLILGNYFIEKTLHNDTKLNGGRQLALRKANSILLENHLRSDSTTDLVDLIQLGLNCRETFKVQLSTLKFVKQHFEVLVANGSVTQISEDIWEIVSDDTFGYAKASALELLADVLDNNAIIPTESKINTLRMLQKSHNEDIQLGALKCLGAFASTFSPNEQDEYLESCRESGNDSLSYNHRLASVQALCLALSKFEKGHQSVQRSRFEVTLLLQGLHDDDESIREIGAAFLSKYTGLQVKTNPFALATQCLVVLYKMSPRHFEIAVKEEFLRQSLQASDIEELSASNEGTLFDIENNNLYINRVDVALTLRNALELVEKLEPETMAEITQNVLKDITSTTNLVHTLGEDEILGWSRDPRIYNLVVVTLLNAQTAQNLNRQDETVKQALSSLRKAFESAKVDVSVSQFIEYRA